MKLSTKNLKPMRPGDILLDDMLKTSKVGYERNNKGQFIKGFNNPLKKQFKLTCVECGNEFTTPNCRKNIAKCCSKECYWKSRSDRFSGANAGHWQGGKPKCKDCGKIIYYSSIYCQHCARRGERNYAWAGGNRSRLIRYEDVEWRNNVFKRDNYTCQKCGQKGGKLAAHHILPFRDFPEFKIKLQNGITLCKKCHSPITKKEWLYAHEFLGI